MVSRQDPVKESLRIGRTSMNIKGGVVESKRCILEAGQEMV